MATNPSDTVRVLRIIARMNIGGPAYHVSLLGGRLDPERYETLLVHGHLASDEGSFEPLAKREGCRVEVVQELGPEISALADLKALAALVRIMRRVRPHIVHTHTAKAGFVGRVAAMLAQRPRPLIVHTYHGHVLEGYFTRPKTLLYRVLERALARVTDRLIGVSQATVDDLVRLRIAPRERFSVVPIGLDLERFLSSSEDAGAEFRARVGARSDEILLAYVGRLVPIKRVDVLINAVALARRKGCPLRLAIVGDGWLRPELERLVGDLGISPSIRFVGYLPDIAGVAAGADLAVLSSDNEGTPVSLIEAAAAGTPAVATAVGGVPDVVDAGRTGLLVARADDAAFAEALLRLVADPRLRHEMGARAPEHVVSRFSSERLLTDVERLYEGLLQARWPGALTPAPRETARPLAR